MLTAEPVHAESARYSASVLCLPGLWSAPAVWRAFAGYLGHRGWESHLLDVRAVAGGTHARAAAVREYVAELGGPVVLVGHDAGALVATAAAVHARPAAIVMLAPLVPGGRAVRRLVLTARSVFALVAGGRVPAPAGVAEATWLDLPEPARSATRPLLADDEAAAVRDVVWGRAVVGAAPGVPLLTVVGAADRLLDRSAAERFVRTTGGELRVVDGTGHWLLAGARWQDVAALVHRWLVQRLGESLLEFYAEAMAERDADEEPPG